MAKKIAAVFKNHPFRFVIFCAIALIFTYSAIIFFSFNPRGDPFNARYSRAVFDRNGEILSVFLDSKAQWHIKSSEPLGDKLTRAIIAFEDKRFYSHFGVDFIAFARSFWHNLTNHKRTGASTITMQTIKLLGRDSRTYFNKFREIIRAVRLESLYSKNEILLLYANNAPYGGNIVGIKTAALYYFNKPPNALSWGQVALLAVLPNAPGLLHLEKNTAQLLKKRDNLLKKLHAQGIISDDNLKIATSEGLPQIKREKNIAPHLSLRLVNELDSRESREFFESPRDSRESLHESLESPLDSPNIYTTIDKNLQRRLESRLKSYHQHLQNLGIQNVAAIIVDTHSREVLAYGGSQDFFDIEGFGQIDGIVAKRSVGSVLKPLLYALSIDNGLIAPESKLIDAPTMWGNFKPQNASKKFYGLVSAQTALIHSLNVPFVALLQDYGYEKFFFDLQNILGFSGNNFEQYGLSLILGTKEFSIEDVAKIYVGLGNLGEFSDLKYTNSPCSDFLGSASPRSLQRTQSAPHSLVSHNPKNSSTMLEFACRVDKSSESLSQGNFNDNKNNKARQFISQGASFLTLQALQKLDRLGIENYYKNEKIFAWKSGTSYGRKDAWAAGTSPKYSIVVWAGNFDGSANPNLFGVNIAGGLLFNILGDLGDLGGAFESPQDSLKSIKIDEITGYAWDSHFVGLKSREILYPKNAKPLRKSPFLKNIFVDSQGNEVDSRDATFINASRATKLDLPINLLDFYKERNLAEFGANANRTKRNVKILYPKNGIKITRTRDFSGENEILARIANLKNNEVFWYLNGAFIGSSTQKVRPINAQSGIYTLTIISSDGESDTVEFLVE